MPLPSLIAACNQQAQQILDRLEHAQRVHATIEAQVWCPAGGTAAPVVPTATFRHPILSAHETIALARHEQIITAHAQDLCTALCALSTHIAAGPAFARTQHGLQLDLAVRHGTRSRAGVTLFAPKQAALTNKHMDFFGGWVRFNTPLFANLCRLGATLDGIGEGPLWSVRESGNLLAFQTHAHSPEAALSWMALVKGHSFITTTRGDRLTIAQEHPTSQQVRGAVHALLEAP